MGIPVLEKLKFQPWHYPAGITKIEFLQYFNREIKAFCQVSKSLFDII